jgi:1-phosphofructokinase
MKNKPSIITVGLAPAWDITCVGQNLEWGNHQAIDEQSIIPAGKALNISHALAWMGQASTAAGLWGAGDFEKMKSFVSANWPLINIDMTVFDGETRKNVTIIDTANQREMHLRAKNELISKKALRQLSGDLKKIVKKGNICVFSGAMPEGEYLEDVLSMIKNCHDEGAKIVLDTSGPALKKIVETGLVWMIKPNLMEMGELSDGQIEDNSAFLIKKARKILNKVENILISRGKNGAIFINNNGVWQSCVMDEKAVFSTVGCGDYLLAGLLKGWIDTQQEDIALSTAIKIAAAKAWGLTQHMLWPEVMEHIKIRLSKSK